MFITYGLLDIA